MRYRDSADLGQINRGIPAESDQQISVGVPVSLAISFAASSLGISGMSLNILTEARTGRPASNLWNISLSR